MRDFGRGITVYQAGLSCASGSRLPEACFAGASQREVGTSTICGAGKQLINSPGMSPRRVDPSCSPRESRSWRSSVRPPARCRHRGSRPGTCHVVGPQADLIEAWFLLRCSAPSNDGGVSC